MPSKIYRPRIADKILSERLRSVGAVLIQGPKWCGKTTTAARIAGSMLSLDDLGNGMKYLQMAKLSPALLLEGATPRLLDEWQLAPTLWDSVRRAVDDRGEPGQFILTGSAVPADRSQIHHSGTGRFSWLTMRTMSLWESGDSNGRVCLGDLFRPEVEVAAVNDLKIADIAYLICRGGWPSSTILPREASLRPALDYLDAVGSVDIDRVGPFPHNPTRVKHLMRSYARHQGTQASLNTISADLASDSVSAIDARTVSAYVDSLKSFFVIEDAPAWNPNLRSRTAIRSSDTRYFTDPSIATAALGIGPNDLLQDPETMGLLFETMAVRDLRVYADTLDGQVSHYRDKNGLECDAVVHLRNGHYGLVEIKLGGDRWIEEAATSLKKLASKIDTSRMPPPAFLMVLSGLTPYAFRRDDGVLIVPIGCLKD